MVEDPTLQKVRAWSETHNIFLQVAAERGLIGLGLFLWILVTLAWSGARGPAGWRETSLALLIGFAVAGLTESWVKDKEVALIFWAIMGAVERRRLAAAEGA